jgi:hypothetical protein
MTDGSLLNAVVQKRYGEDGGAFSLRPVVARVEQAAPHWTQSHDLEIRPADDAGADRPGFAQPEHGELDHREVAEGAERLDA